MRHIRRIAGVLTAVVVTVALGNPVAYALPPNQVTVVLVHGAWADTSSWDGEVAALEKQGYHARAVVNPLRNLITDAGAVADDVRSIDGPVVLVGHSYGGAVISQAAASAPNVKALVFVDAYAPEVGESAATLNGEGSVVASRPDDQLYDVSDYPGAPPGAVDLRLKKDVFLNNFASDLPREQATQLWATQHATSTSALKTPNTETAWKTIPSWAFISSGDQIITPASKSFMAQRANATTTTFPGGSHLTLISHPDAVAAVIESAAAAVVG
ncbi:alpha/beta hydrolase [Mycobacterium sp. CBMA293]|uniref:alpha/beta fold hydrolase n=1 Tax=unclassified Mycolicibacterium TaxID=2636767 RepID=UPI0012DF5A85|nr:MULTISPECIES: alpha/beta fold hydrolase [unclassified Mycolicibacterium]MUL47237.1 alpha/beta hydrolase [Mycolicibacterium sp. CBMA 360]MUL61347.1 alpha/beta hydrolase [Mycolicibacterium sp. CBMA 335]MUL72082.1 alpha/beta hydrolase [Mycolicibacterium sp. CBMA 311]MUL96249.1 alpha/beta hydrolase [Mycolicibacterium sp. CBMA 230]MUM08927.1 alpha/beta hydrolase [Mycolicibacterium sp. CBMA 213]